MVEREPAEMLGLTGAQNELIPLIRRRPSSGYYRYASVVTSGVFGDHKLAGRTCNRGKKQHDFPRNNILSLFIQSALHNDIF